MRRLRMAGFPQLVSETMPKVVYYAVVDGQQAGPMSESELKAMVKKRIINAETLMWTPQLTQWTPAKFISTVNKHLLLNQKRVDVKKDLGSAMAEHNPVYQQLVSAIVNLGFSKTEAANVAEKVIRSDKGISVENGIKAALKMLC